MALVPQSFSLENIKLQFHSFIHPETGELWATANAIAKSLGYENPADAIYKYVKNPTFKSKWKDLTEGLCVVQRLPYWQNNTMMINEGGINRLIMACHLQNVDRYQDWVCGTVLPTICQTGQFNLNKRDKELVQLTNGLLESNRALI
jgi:prophage antirepressor-like protein